ncbi:aldo/keto reductase [Pseudomonas sp. B21-035]|uniref:aldo/keto reductase n=1 Tax=Pseudomonas sp. B21-035 TaxID=2895484 RepID=UPI002160253D|nr:aldo/keto reductase [Pseudomonas sp. B21-035]UVL54329.1 aldo/keto reductase [Pseudomonas sp. B21-035]
MTDTKAPLTRLQTTSHKLSRIGQGTWYMGEDPARQHAEVAALQHGIELGLNLIDTAEMYAEGGAETVVGKAIAGRREQVFLVSKVYPHNASLKGIPAACERSLKRLGTEHIDLYLLHWRGQYPLAETVEAFERLRVEGKIGRWGVSNFDVDDLRELYQLSGDCAVNQVLYNPSQRGIEYDLLPWSHKRNLPTMAYCPLAQAGRLLKHPTLAEIAERHGATPAQVSLAWVIRQDGVIAIPKAADLEHVRLNAAAANLVLSSEDLRAIDRAFAPPTRKQHLSMV